MFQSWRLSQKIGRQGQKNVIGGTFPSYFTKLFIILYGLVKMTSGCYTPESVPEKKIIEIRTVYPPGSNHTQCYNMPSGHKFAFKISTYLPQLKVNVNDTVLASVLEEYYHYAYLFEEELEEEVRMIRLHQTNANPYGHYHQRKQPKSPVDPLSVSRATCARGQHFRIQSGAPHHFCDKSNTNDTG
jgi:hypothetical protein